MPATLQELASFTKFAQEILTTSESKLSLEDCIRLWRQHCEQEETAADIRQGRIDREKGLGQPIKEAFEDIRRQLGVN